jgi:uncharacterized protein YjiS (DUF1127 family)
MDLLNRLQNYLELRRRERETMHELAQLSDRALGDLGLARADIRRIARAAARAGRLDLAAYRARREAPSVPAMLVGQGLGLRAV